MSNFPLIDARLAELRAQIEFLTKQKAEGEAVLAKDPEYAVRVRSLTEAENAATAAEKTYEAMRAIAKAKVIKAGKYGASYRRPKPWQRPGRSSDGENTTIKSDVLETIAGAINISLLKETQVEELGRMLIDRFAADIPGYVEATTEKKRTHHDRLEAYDRETRYRWRFVPTDSDYKEKCEIELLEEALKTPAKARLLERKMVERKKLPDAVELAHKRLTCDHAWFWSIEEEGYLCDGCGESATADQVESGKVRGRVMKDDE